MPNVNWKICSSYKKETNIWNRMDLPSNISSNKKNTEHKKQYKCGAENRKFIIPAPSSFFTVH